AQPRWHEAEGVYSCHRGEAPISSIQHRDKSPSVENDKVRMTNDELNPNDEIPSSIRRQIGKRLRVDHSVFVIWPKGQQDVSHQIRSAADKRFASAAPICRCNDRMALYRGAAPQSPRKCGLRARRW